MAGYGCWAAWLDLLKFTSEISDSHWDLSLVGIFYYIYVTDIKSATAITTSRPGKYRFRLPVAAAVAKCRSRSSEARRDGDILGQLPDEKRREALSWEFREEKLDEAR